jgi:hypothetical protein
MNHARWALAALALASCPLHAQGRIVGAATETRRVTQALDQEVARLVARGSDAWLAYRVPAVATTRQMCGGSHVVLEYSTEIAVMARIERSVISRLRVFTPECDVDAGSVPLIWLEGVVPDDSARWLASLATAHPEDHDWQARVAEPAVGGLSLHTGDAAVRALIVLARDDQRTSMRNRALLALGQRAGQQAAAAIADAVERDPEAAVKRTAVQALARLPKDEGVPLLIDVARTSHSADARREAMVRLGQANDARAVKFFEEILLK